MSAQYEQREHDPLHGLAEVWPDEAPARIQPVYEDLRTALRVPDVPFPFRFLANWPPYLAFAVRQFSPFVRSLAFEAAAETLRTELARALAPAPRRGTFERARAVVLREHELAPKLLLILTAFWVGLRGRSVESAPVLGTSLPEPEPLPVRPAELPRKIDERIAPLPDLRSVPDTARATLDELATLRSAPAVDDFSRALAVTDPAALAEVVALRRALATTLDPLRVRVDELADRLVRRFTLPGSKVLPDFSVPLSALPVIEVTVAALVALAREALLDVTLARVAADGASAAERSPFPLEIVAER